MTTTNNEVSSFWNSVRGFTGASVASNLNLILLILAAIAQPLFLLSALIDGAFDFFYEPATFPPDQWIRPIAGILAFFLLLRIRHKPRLVFAISLFPWAAGLLVGFLVSTIQGGVDRWTEELAATERSFGVGIAGTLELVTLTLAFGLGLLWLLSDLVSRVFDSEGIAHKINLWLTKPIRTPEEIDARRTRLRKSQLSLLVALYLFALTLLFKIYEPFSSGYFDFSYPGGETPSDQWLRLGYVFILFLIASWGRSKPVILPLIGAFAFVWNTFLESAFVVVIGQSDRLFNYNSAAFESFDSLSGIALTIVVLLSIWVVAEALILDYKKRVMAWAEKRSDHYAGLDIHQSAAGEKQQVSILAVFGLVFAFLIPIVGLILSYAARNDIVLSKGHKTGFDMAVTASIVAWATLLLQALALGFLILTGSLFEAFPWLFFGDSTDSRN
jgi:hypothetical protein